MDWQAYLKNVFSEIRDKGIEHLIIDIRGNEGGADAVGEVLAGYLLAKPLRIEDSSDKLRYEVVPPEVAPFVQTWDLAFKDLRGKVKPLGNGYYTWAKEQNDVTVVKPLKPHFRGQTYLLVDAANSSATFFLAKQAKKYGLATLIGEQTGGNKQGINGGMMFFVHLPNSQIEFDIPLMNFAPKNPQPDEGIFPNVELKESLSDFLADRDVYLEKALELIKAPRKH